MAHSTKTEEDARKGKGSDRENRGSGGAKQSEEHRISHQGRNSGNNKR